MENEKINLTEFTKNYLSALGISQEKIDENTGKVLYTVILSTIKDQTLSDDQKSKLENVAKIAEEGKKQEAYENLKTIFDGTNAETLQTMFVGKLVDYLLDMTDKMGGSLTEEQKQKLAGLINGLGN